VHYRRKKTPRAILILSLLLSALINAFLAWLGPRLASVRTQIDEIAAQVPIEVDLVEPEAPEAAEKLKLVQNQRIESERAPEKTERISEFDSTVEKESRAAQGRTLVQPSTGAPVANRQKSRDAAKSGGQQESKASEPSKSRDATKGSKLDPGEEAMARDDGELAPGQSQEKGNEGQAVSPMANLSPRSLMPSAHDLRQSGTIVPSPSAGTPTQPQMVAPGTYDDLDDVQEGGLNLLNTKRFKYASFFNRVRDAIAQHWSPEPVHQRADPTGQVYGKKTRVTVLKIRLDAQGKLVSAVILDESGARHLDQEALRSVRAAAPFANPPLELIDPATNGIEFRFGFELTFNGSRIFRYRGR
jgi:TonB family protein